ncbi:MAG TPA: diaminopimelate epimerase, partial [Kiloniellales bacterium]|nr:diaminopimelate epimerase [Kiloniellales bacterium]
MEIRSFVKMHGLGNDFVVIDARSEPLALTEAAARRLADRRLGVGCDQVVLIEPPGESPGPEANGADVALRFLNADG